MKEKIVTFTPWITGAVVFGVYLTTLAPSVVHIDSGELAAVQATLGIAHPTGYPLFTILGNLFLYLPIPETVIYRLNLLCAIWCTLGVIFYGLSIRTVIDNRGFFAAGRPQKNQPDFHFLTKIVAISGGMFVLALSKTYWLQSTSVEVYSLHLAILSAAIWCLINAYIVSISEGVESQTSKKWWFISSIVLGFGIANHMTIIFFVPSIAVAFFIVHRWNKTAVIRILQMVLISLTVVIFSYVYLYIRANDSDTMLLWGDPSTLSRLWSHITAVQYSGLMFRSTEVVEYNLLNFLKSIPFEVAFGGVVLMITGMFYVANTMMKLFQLLFLAIVVNISLSVNYDIRDIYTYHLLTYFVLSIFAAFGIYAIVQWASRNIYLHAVSICVVVSIIAVQGYLNSGISHRNLYAYEDYVTSILDSVEPNAIIFGSLHFDWDLFVSGSIYYQYVENYRPDVIIVEGGLFGSDWFSRQIERRHPGIFDSVKEERSMLDNAFLQFMKTRSYDDEIVWQRSYVSLLKSAIVHNIGRRPVYFTPAFMNNEFQKQGISIPVGYSVIPEVYLYKVSKGDSFVPIADSVKGIRYPKIRNGYINNIQFQISTVLYSRATSYHPAMQKQSENEKIMKIIPQLCPDIPINLLVLGKK